MLLHLHGASEPKRQYPCTTLRTVLKNILSIQISDYNFVCNSRQSHFYLKHFLSVLFGWYFMQTKNNNGDWAKCFDLWNHYTCIAFSNKSNSGCATFASCNESALVSVAYRHGCCADTTYDGCTAQRVPRTKELLACNKRYTYDI
jgi:hypothetical protein